MKKSDIAAIKLGGPAFERSWWDERRGILAANCGVGKGLENFSKLYQKNPELISHEGEILTLKKAIEELRTALQKAKKRTGKIEKDTSAACDAYLKILDEYEKKLGLGVTEGDDDEKTWKEVLVAMPKAISQMTKTQKEIEKAKQSLKEHRETAELLRTRALARNKLPLSGGSRSDLENAHELLIKAIQKLNEYTNGAVYAGSRAANDVMNIAEKLRSRKYDKDMRAFSEMALEMGRHEGSLRDELTKTVKAAEVAGEAIAQTQKTVDRVRDLVHTYKEFFWNSPSGVENLKHTLKDLASRAQKIIDTDLNSIDEGAKRELSADMRLIDSDRLQLDSNLTNMGNIVRTTVADTKAFTKDKELVKILKEMLLAYKEITTTHTKLELLLKEASKKITEMT